MKHTGHADRWAWISLQWQSVPQTSLSRILAGIPGPTGPCLRCPSDPVFKHNSGLCLRPKATGKVCFTWDSWKKYGEKYSGAWDKFKDAKNPIFSLSPPHFIICFIFRNSEGEMTTSRNSMSGIFQADPMKGPTAMHPIQKIIPKRMTSVVGPTQNFFMRESKTMGVSQLHSILYPRDSLAHKNRCYRPGRECNPTKSIWSNPRCSLYLTQYAKSGMCREVTTVIYLLLTLWFAYLGVSHPSVSPASQTYSPWKWPRWWVKWI